MFIFTFLSFWMKEARFHKISCFWQSDLGTKAELRVRKDFHKETEVSESNRNFSVLSESRYF